MGLIAIVLIIGRCAAFVGEGWLVRAVGGWGGDVLGCLGIFEERFGRYAL